MKNGHRSKFSNLSNWKEEAWKKKSGFNGIRTRDLRVAGALLYQLSYEGILSVSTFVKETTIFHLWKVHKRGTFSIKNVI